MARLRRLFVPELPVEGGSVPLPPESVGHVHVLRLASGALVELFDASGRVAQAEITSVERDRVLCAAQPSAAGAVRSGRLHLVVCLPKPAQLETIVRMSTELGVTALHLATSERTVPKLASDAKLERLRRISREASAQSGAGRTPELTGPRTLQACIAAAPDGALKLAFWERASAPLPTAGGAEFEDREIWAVIGPEGGLSEAEALQLEAAGCLLTSLGTHILRAETACVVIAALLLDRMLSSASSQHD
jgi:16S rRNA (uracil1498-N3)-methyltransferase